MTNLVDLSTDADGLADFLSCLAGLEDKNAQLFNLLSKKTFLLSIKSMLQKIGEDNQKHSQQLYKISDKIGNPTVRTKECKRKLSVVCENTETILKIMQKRDEISINELSDFLEILESSGGAAQFLLVQAETFLFMSEKITKLYGIDGKEFNHLLETMVQDIEENIHLLEEIKSEVEKEQNKNKQKHPIFKYQSPDSWATPSHSQKSKHVI